MATSSTEIVKLSKEESENSTHFTELYGRAFDENFVDDVRSYRCLWDTTCRGFKDRQMKRKVFEVLGEKYGRTAAELKKVWKNHHENFSRCLKKREQMTRSGAPAAYLPECKLFHQLQFLRDKVFHRLSVCYIPEQATSEDKAEQSFFQPISPASSAPSPSQSIDSISSQSKKRKASEIPVKLQKNIALTEKVHPDTFLYEASQQKFEHDADQSFVNSIVPILKSLPAKKNRLAKIEIQQMLLQYEFEDLE